MNANDKDNKPPNWGVRFLGWFCSDRLIEGILGDLLEQYDEDVKEKGYRRANWRYARSVFGLIHPIIFRDFKIVDANILALAKNHLVVAIRSMKKYKFYALTNIMGLALAISFVFLGYLFIQKEISFDHFHTKKNRTYRLYGYTTDAATGERIAGSLNGCTPIPLVGGLAERVTGISYYSRLGSTGGTVLMDQVPYAETIAMADRDFLTMFDFPILQGDPGALAHPNAILLSEQKSKKYFGLENPVGKPLQVILGDTSLVFQVAGVLDSKQNVSSLRFDFLVPFECMKLVTSEEAYHSYAISFIESYVTFDQPQSADVSTLLSSAVGGQLDDRSGKGMIGLQPLTDVHFNTQIQGMYPAASVTKVWVLGGLSLLVLVVALVNFITLSVGHSLHRMKEIGLRKVFGAHKGNLRTQLILESLVIAFVSSGLSMLLTIYLLPSFGELIGGGIDQNLVVMHLPFIVILWSMISIIAGGLQAFVLVRLAPLRALRGVLKFKVESRFNEVAMVFQLAASVLLIFSTLVIQKQMNFVQARDLGFNHERLIEVAMNTSGNRESTWRTVEHFKSAISKNPVILASSAMMNGFKDPWTKLTFRQADQSDLELRFNLVDESYIETMDIEIISGHSFAHEESHLPTDILVNESLVKMMNWEHPLGQQIPGQNFRVQHRVVGVVEDFHFGSLHDKIEPLILAKDPRSIQSGITGLSTYEWPPNWYGMVIRLGPGDLVDAINSIERAWNEINPEQAFTFHFVDEMLASKYAEELRWRKMIRMASVFAITIAWLGLLALTRLALQRRTREIGIRKILGSSVFGIIQKLSLSYVILVVLACLLAAPLGWWAMDHWLASFTYRIDLSPFTFVVSSLTVLLITTTSIVFQSYRAGLTNPVDSLRSE